MKKPSHIFLVLVFMLIIQNMNAQQTDMQPLEIGEKAPDFDLPATDGKNYTLADFDEYEVLFIVFWANHCPTAQAYEDKLIGMVEKYRPRSVGFVAISPNSPEALSLSELGYTDLADDFNDMVIRAAYKKYNFPYLYDGDDHEASIPYGPVATPHVYIFDNQRTLRYRGRIDDTENPYEEPGSTDAKNAIEALLGDKEVSVRETPSFGCSIKWQWNDEWKKRLEQQWAEMPVSIEMAGIETINGLIENNSVNLRLINIWATWCGPCIVEFPDLITIDRMYRGRNFEFISISADNPSKKDNVLNFLKDHEASNQNFLYESSDKYALIEAVDKDWQGALPHTLLIAPGGEIIGRYAGVIDPLTVKRDIVGYLGRYFADD